MKGFQGLDAIDQGILHFLSLYEHLNLSDLWFEIGEAGTLGPITKEEISRRLQSLMNQGLVEQVTLEDGDIRWAFKRI
jgi:DNA-binding HxlR family transcriptional regulator